MNIFDKIPINKTAASVINQASCQDTSSTMTYDQILTELKKIKNKRLKIKKELKIENKTRRQWLNYKLKLFKKERNKTITPLELELLKLNKYEERLSKMIAEWKTFIPKNSL